MKFIEEMRNRGYAPPDALVSDGKIHRIRVQDDRTSEKSGWYMLCADGTGQYGVCGNWRTNERWSWSGEQQEATSQHLSRYNSYEHARSRAMSHDTAARIAALHLSISERVTENAYLDKKGCSPINTKCIGDVLIVPMYDTTISPGLRNLQYIYHDGVKRFVAGGQCRGCYHIIGSALTKPILICEGYATGLTLHEATGHTVIVGFYASNLIHVIDKILPLVDAEDIIICADDDSVNKINIGINAANEIKNKHPEIKIRTPQFDPTIPRTKFLTDFNDQARQRGIDSVRTTINTEI